MLSILATSDFYEKSFFYVRQKKKKHQWYNDKTGYYTVNGTEIKEVAKPLS